MPRLQVYVPEEVAHILASQARSLLLGRQQYIRAILAAVAARAEPATEDEQRAGARQPAGRPDGEGAA